MKRLFAIASFFCLCMASLAAAALTLEPVPGSTPQSTRLYSYFPVAPAVIVRDASGNAVPGVEVTFSWAGGNVPYLIGSSEGNTAISGSDGVAEPPEDLIAGGIAGSLVLTAATTRGETASFTLTIAPGEPTQVEVVSGNGQYAQVGTYYARPWVLRALDADGLPVPYASLWVLVADAEGLPSGTLDGLKSYAARADAAGVIVTSRLLAGPLAGQGYGVVSPVSGQSAYVQFENVAFPVPAHTTLVSGPPQSVEVGHTTLQPWVVRVTGFSGEPAAGVPVTFATAVECGSFGGATNVTVVTGANGLVTSPLFTGTQAVACSVWTQTGGISPDESLDLTVQVFDPALVAITPSDRYIEIKPDTAFSVDVAFTESDRPIYGAPFTVQVVGAHNGASATLTGQQAPFDSNVARLNFVGNRKQGYYAIVITRGPVRTWIAVEQRR